MADQQNGAASSPRLEGWKEIAAFFGKGVRTVQVWEAESGLPVHRFKGRVWAEAAELAAWLDANQNLARAADPTPPAPHPRNRRRAAALALLGLAVCAVCAAAAFAAWRWLAPRRNPVELRTAGRVLTALDAANRPVWTFTLPAAPQPWVVAENHPLDYPRTLFTDLDGDGLQELLYVYWAPDMNTAGTTLYCFRPDGSVAWTFKAGRPLTTHTGKPVSGVYHTSVLGALRQPRADGGRLIVGSQHVYSWPYQVALLRADGTLAAEYFHPGWLLKLALADLDRDGHEELLLGGVNGDYGQITAGDHGASLVVLDSRRIAGQGAIPGGLALRGIPAAEETAVLQFPAPGAHPSEYYRVHRVRSDGQSVEVEVRLTAEPAGTPYAIYRLDRRLDLLDLMPSTALQGTLAQEPDGGRATLARLRRVLVVRNRLGGAGAR